MCVVLCVRVCVCVVCVFFFLGSRGDLLRTLPFSSFFPQVDGSGSNSLIIWGWCRYLGTLLSPPLEGPISGFHLGLACLSPLPRQQTENANSSVRHLGGFSAELLSPMHGPGSKHAWHERGMAMAWPCRKNLGVTQAGHTFYSKYNMYCLSRRLSH